jgi:hypothetical protein
MLRKVLARAPVSKHALTQTFLGVGMMALLAMAFAAGGLMNLPPRFEITCTGKELYQKSEIPGDSSITNWSINIKIDLSNKLYKIDGGQKWLPIAWLGETSTIFVKFNKIPPFEGLLDLKALTFNSFGVNPINTAFGPVIEHGICTISSDP